MDQKTKLILALHQIENVSKLLHDGQYATFFNSHLIRIKFEIERQLCCLTNITTSSKLKE